MGVFCTGFSAMGTTPCLICGVAFPQNYSCCPGLLVFAVRMLRTKDSGTAIEFIETNMETMLNSIRGGFIDLFNKQQRKLLRKFSDKFQRGKELVDAIEVAG